MTLLAFGDVGGVAVFVKSEVDPPALACRFGITRLPAAVVEACSAVFVASRGGILLVGLSSGVFVLLTSSSPPLSPVELRADLSPPTVKDQNGESL